MKRIMGCQYFSQLGEAMFILDVHKNIAQNTDISTKSIANSRQHQRKLILMLMQ